MARPVWLQFHQSISLTAGGISAVDLLAGHMDQLQVSERTVVAIKGSISATASDVTLGTNICEFHVGLIVGNDNLSSADFPVIVTDGLINPGWMYRHQVILNAAGDGTLPIQIDRYNHEFDVKAKRSLQGLGDQTLWLITNIQDAVGVGAVVVTGQILLAQKG